MAKAASVLDPFTRSPGLRAGGGRMSVRLRPLSEGEFDAYLESMIPAYANQEA